MIHYDSKSGFDVVSVLSSDEFFVKLNDGGTEKRNRENLLELRALIDKALNTSQEEIEAW